MIMVVCKVCGEDVPSTSASYDTSLGFSLGLVCDDCEPCLDNYLLNHAAAIIAGYDNPDFTD